MNNLPFILLLPATQVARSDFLTAFNRAYSDYFVPLHFDPPAFDLILERESIRIEASAAALQGDQIVGIGMLGVRGQRAWIGGMGVIPEYRHQGIGRQMMRWLLDQARALGVKRIQLEVITQNAPAIALYGSLGFRHVREMAVLTAEPIANLPSDPPLNGTRITAEGPVRLIKLMDQVSEFRTPWQRDRETILQIVDRVDGLLAQESEGTPQGIALWSGAGERAGILALLARTPDIGAALLRRIRLALPEASLYYSNVPTEDPLLPMLKQHGFTEVIAQYEMEYDL
jgi:ribosomal protein S18 acetylase RimI-like enzyme